MSRSRRGREVSRSQGTGADAIAQGEGVDGVLHLAGEDTTGKLGWRWIGPRIEECGLLIVRRGTGVILTFRRRGLWSRVGVIRMIVAVGVLVVGAEGWGLPIL